MVRTQETRFAKWTECDQLYPNEPLSRLSPERMKMSREHLVPLRRQAVQFLKRLKKLWPDSYTCFPQARAMASLAKTHLCALYRMGCHGR